MIDKADNGKVLVTGGTGFIGRWLVKRLLELNKEVIAFDNLANSSLENVAEFRDNPNFSFIKGDVTNKEDLARAFVHRLECVYHLAAQNNVQESLDEPGNAYRNNLRGTYLILEECRKNNTRVLIMGTCMVYAPAKDSALTEEHPTMPKSLYAATKLAAEELALSYYHGFGLPVVIVRPFNTYGPYQKCNNDGGVVAIFMSRHNEGEELEVRGDGTQTRDLLYVEDCAEFLVQAGEKETVIGHIINAGSGRDISINELAAMICPEPARIRHIPHIHPQSEIMKLCCDSSKAEALLGWKPQTTIQQGIEQMREWLRQQNALKEQTQLKKEEKKIAQNTFFGKSIQWLEKAKRYIPTASQTYSKSYRYYCEGAGPAFLEQGRDATVWDIDGNEYLDFVCGLGAITVGYNNREVNQAIEDQLRKGIAFSQPTILETQLAKRIVELVPCAEMVKFVKNGSDATTAAVRIARAYTNRELILFCGYHGFQDWFAGSLPHDRGIPKEMKKLLKPFVYNDIESLKKLCEENKEKVAAVIMEPIREEGPLPGFLAEVKKIARENGALLIFDEIVSGFRFDLGGAQKRFGVTPDLCTLGKGMGNGLPIAAVAGKRELMTLIDEGVFISSTGGGETLSLAGALATLRILERENYPAHIQKLGEKWKQGVRNLLEKKKMNQAAKVAGDAPHCGLVFSKTGSLEPEELFSVYQQTLLAHGILALPFNDFCLAHTEENITTYLNAVDTALDAVNEAIVQGSVKNRLKGGLFRPVFRR